MYKISGKGLSITVYCDKDLKETIAKLVRVRPCNVDINEYGIIKVKGRYYGIVLPDKE